MKNKYRLVDEYKYLGFRPLSKVQAHSHFSDARVIVMRRRQKKLYAAVAAQDTIHTTTSHYALSVIDHAAMPVYILRSRFDV